LKRDGTPASRGGEATEPIQLEFVSITSELGDDTTSNAIRQIMAPSDEYQSKEERARVGRSGKLQSEAFWRDLFCTEWRARRDFELL